MSETLSEQWRCRKCGWRYGLMTAGPAPVYGCHGCGAHTWDPYPKPAAPAFEGTDTEVERLRAAIRLHRDQRGDDRCWMDDEKLYQALPEGYSPPDRDTAVELENCKRFIACRHNPNTEYVSPQREIERLQALALSKMSRKPCLCGGDACIGPRQLNPGFVCVREAGLASLAKE